jgi:plastocyanin
MARHTVTRRMTDEPFDSGLLENQDMFTHQFKTAGTYDYVCVPHAGMQGTIIVK